MPNSVKRILSRFDLEERILIGASVFALVSVFSPWFSGEWLGQEFVSFSGVRFFTSFLGIFIALLHACLLYISIAPAVGGPVLIRRRYREIVRLCLASQATVLALAALSVLTKITYDYTRMEIRFGVYFTFAASLVAAFYAFWKLQEQRRGEPHEVFHHPDDLEPPAEHEQRMHTPPPPPPPPPPEPEEHRIRP